MKTSALQGLTLIVVASVAFFAGLHWHVHKIQSQLTRALGTQLVCTAGGLLSDVTVASLLDKKDDRDAQDILLIDIKSEIAKLKAFGLYLNKEDRAKAMDALQDGEKYISAKHSR